MQLYLMRHGEAEARASADAARRLTSFGESQATAVAAGLQGEGIEIDCLLVSPYQRAAQTARPLIANLPASGRHATVPWLTPEAAPAETLEGLESIQAQSVMLVSHMPLVSRLAGLLLEGQEQTGQGFDTAGVLAMELEFPAPGLGRLRWYRRSHQWVTES